MSESASYSNKDEGPRGHVQLDSVHVHNDTLLLKASYDRRLTRYLTTGLFYARYDFPIDQVPRPILVIPLLGLLVPIAWLTGAEIRVGDVDEQYLESLPLLAREFRRMFPKVNFSERIEAHPVTIKWEWEDAKYCLLYSRGVDSTSSLIRNLEKRPALMTVRGTPDVLLHEEDYWSRVQDRVKPFVRGLGVEPHVVETNAIDMFRRDSMKSDFESRLGVGWWEGLAHGLFLLSICAPYTYVDRIGNLMIASTYTRENQKPWGSNPMTDEKVRWGGIKVIHDSYDLDRVEKIRQVLAPFMKGTGTSVPLRVCIGNETVRLASNELNCGRCSKCMMVEFTLLISGIDPGKCGFDISPESLMALKRNMETGRFGREVDPATWLYVKRNAMGIPEDVVRAHPGLGDFLKWFAVWDERTVNRNRSLNLVAPRGSRRRNVARALFGRTRDE